MHCRLTPYQSPSTPLQASTRTGWWPAAAACCRTPTSCRRLQALRLGPTCCRRAQLGLRLSTTSTAPLATLLPPVSRGLAAGLAGQLCLHGARCTSLRATLACRSLPSASIVRPAARPPGTPSTAGGARSGIQISQLPPRTRLDAPWPRQVGAPAAACSRRLLFVERRACFLLPTARRSLQPHARSAPCAESCHQGDAAAAGALRRGRPVCRAHVPPGGVQLHGSPRLQASAWHCMASCRGWGCTGGGVWAPRALTVYH